MQDKLTEQQIAEVHEYWEDDDFGKYNDPIFEFIPVAERQELDRYAVNQLAREHNRTEEDFRKNVLGEGELGRRFDSIWGGELAQRVIVNFSLSIDSRLEAIRDFAWAGVCVRLDYCAKRKKGTFEKEGVNVALAVADALLSVATHIPLPITLASVYLVKRGLLDKWCKCRSEA